MNNRRKKLVRYSIGVVALVAIGVVAMWMLPDSTPVRPKFTVSKETTYLTTPLRERPALVDYPAAFDAKYARDVTPENNALVLLWQVFGPDDNIAEIKEAYFKKLGMSPPADSKNYLFRPSAPVTKVKEVIGGITLYTPSEKPKEVREPLDEFETATERPWKRDESPKLASWLDSKTSLLKLAVEATNRPRYYSPMIRAGEGSPMISLLLPVAQSSRQLARALIARGMLAVSEGRIEDARQDAFACHRLSRLVGQGPSVLEMLISIAIERMAEDLEIAILSSNKLTKAQSLQIAADLRRLPPPPNLTRVVGETERCTCLDAILDTADKSAKSLMEVTMLKVDFAVWLLVSRR